MKTSSATHLLAGLLLSLLPLTACGSDEPAPEGAPAGAGGSGAGGKTPGGAGGAGQAGTSPGGTGGVGGTQGGKAGVGGAGAAGKAGAAGASAGQGGGGSGGTGGNGGVAGASAGASGSGAGGSMSGSSGVGGAGSGGAGAGGSDAGAGGDAGTGGSDAGAGGSEAGAGGDAGAGGGDAGAGGSTAGAGGSEAGGGGMGGGGAGGAPLDPECAPTPGYEQIGLKEINDGTISTVNNTAQVRLTLMATTTKLLVSKTASGNCVWGFYATQASGVVAEYSNILVTSYGATVVPDPSDPGKFVCPQEDGSQTPGDTVTGAGWIPNSLKPGDVLTVSGKVMESTSFSSCTVTSSRTQTTLQMATKAHGCFSPGGTGTVVPRTMTGEELARLASPSDGDMQRRWGGASIQLTGPFTAKRDMMALDPGDKYSDATTAVSSFGRVVLAETALQVNTQVLSKSLLAFPDLAARRLSAKAGDTFTTVQGIYAHDACTWRLSATDRCAVFSPKPADCP